MQALYEITKETGSSAPSVHAGFRPVSTVQMSSA